VDLGDLTEFRKSRANGVGAGLKGEIAYVETIAHDCSRFMIAALKNLAIQ
jgi:hypothetical protein